jgi:hypothetical protein
MMSMLSMRYHPCGSSQLETPTASGALAPLGLPASTVVRTQHTLQQSHLSTLSHFQGAVLVSDTDMKAHE